jgi:hypothetical protein
MERLDISNITENQQNLLSTDFGTQTEPVIGDIFSQAEIHLPSYYDIGKITLIYYPKFL